jgi:uncharacterized protein YjiS (DUF1127 family)
MVVMGLSLSVAAAIAIATFWTAMRRGVRALEQMGG